MNRLLLGSVAIIAAATVAPAMAADLPRKVAPPVVAPVPTLFNWGGCYLGVAGGGAWGRSHADNNGTTGPIPTIPITGDFDVRGGIIGGTTGCNLLQAGNWVFGVESDFSWTNKHGTANDLPPFDTTESNETREKWLSTTRVRVGYAWNNWLLYATAGAAIGEVAYTAFGPNNFGPGIPGSVSETHTRAGWTAGAGIEWAFAPNWSAKLEYLYVDFGRTEYFNPLPPGLPPGFANRAGGLFLNDNIVRVGVNWRFNWGKGPAPVVARY
jgi:outer membrane immunogenic protein